jgi:hypothetical protein
MKFRNLLFLTLLFFPSIAFANDIDTAIAIKFVRSMTTISEGFTLKLYNALTLSFKSLFYKIAVIAIVIHAVQMMFGKHDLIGMLRLFLTIAFVNSLAFTKGVFENWIYRPIMETVYSLPAFVIQSTTDTKYSSSKSALEAMLTSMNSALTSLVKVAAMIMKENGLTDIGGSGLIFIQALAIEIIYYGLYCVFIVMFTIGIVAAHVMLATAPFAVTLIAFPQLRGISFNIIRAFISYSLIPFFASVAMGMTLFSMTTLVDEANRLIELGKVEEIGDDFFMQAIVIGIFSWFFHLKSSEFASQTIGGAISNFGQNFANLAGVAAGVGKVAGGKLALPVIAKARQGATGASNWSSDNSSSRWNKISTISNNKK